MKKVFAIFLTLLILTMNVGLTLSTHYCKGKAVKSAFSVGRTNVGCGMEAKKKFCKFHSQKSVVERKGCCENKYVQLKVEDKYSKTAIAKIKVGFSFITKVPVPYTVFYSLESLTLVKTKYLNYSPPLLESDIPVLVQTFRI